jgi:hypothetical protein
MLWKEGRRYCEPPYRVHSSPIWGINIFPGFYAWTKTRFSPSGRKPAFCRLGLVFRRRITQAPLSRILHGCCL